MSQFKNPVHQFLYVLTQIPSSRCRQKQERHHGPWQRDRAPKKPQYQEDGFRNTSRKILFAAQVSSVKLSYSCLFPEVRRVFCSADGDNLHYSWTSAFNTRLEDNNKTIVLDIIHNNNNVTCHVENHVSHEHNSINLPTCIDFMIVFVLVWLFEVIILLSVLVGSLYIYPRIYRKQRTPERPGSSVTLNKD
ncbi:uncharacterized protein LOC125138883 isoform X2 [Tachysurus fulvidraco]|uniref:uncharacterized protein LOC125138883 isoform X2 n=1 Tax=Tachysurus fulvidraco TaxID=1234273 RepID=UPI001FEEE905|nr:uncharacterized protein LOC125138883 isoform X2 [Tachysurus fulvidraco]